MACELKYYANFEDWFDENIDPIFAEISDIVAQEIKQNKASPLLNDYLMIFIKNSIALFKLLSSPIYSYQIIMTLRLLMEMSADILFISKFPENMQNIEKRFNTIQPKFSSLTYDEVGVEAKRFRLWKFGGGKKSGNATSTETRIELAYGTGGLRFYRFLNAYSHFNHLGVMYDLCLTHPNNTSAHIDSCLRLLPAYPNYFKTFVNAIGILCKSSRLIEYDCSKMNQAMNSLRLRKRTGATNKMS